MLHKVQQAVDQSLTVELAALLSGMYMAGPELHSKLPTLRLDQKLSCLTTHTTCAGSINQVALCRARLVLGWVTHRASTPGAGNFISV